MSDEDIQAKVNQYTADNPALEQAAAGLSADSIKAAAESYTVQLQEIQTLVDQAEVDADGNVVIDVPVQSDEATWTEMTVQVDLGAYLAQAESTYQEKKADYIAKLAAKLYADSEGFKYTEMQAAAKAAAEALYDLNTPSALIQNNGDGTLSLLDADTYYSLLTKNLEAVSTLWTALDENTVFYTKYLDSLKASLDGSDTLKKMEISYAWHEDLATMLGEQGGILNGNAGEKLLEITYNAVEDDYNDLLELVTSYVSGDVSDAIPSTMPEQLGKLLGSYALTITINEQ
jgi:hypothetical protein